MSPLDPREHDLMDAAQALCANVIASQQGYPLWLAVREAATTIKHMLGVRLILPEPLIAPDDIVFNVRDLSLRRTVWRHRPAHVGAIAVRDCLQKLGKDH